MFRSSLPAVCLSLAATTASPQSPAEASTPREAPPLATPAQVARALEDWEAAEDEGDGYGLALALEEMVGFANEEFLEPALAGLEYRATRTDKARAREEAAEAGERGRDAIARLVREREEAVQVAAAQVLATAAGEEAPKKLLRALRDRDVQAHKPRLVAAALDALGLLGSSEGMDTARRLLDAFEDRRSAAAAIRYIGRVGTEDLGVVLRLCRLLDPPQPEWVDDPNNPPASYWEARWRVWQGVRRDLTWALRELTGETFLCAEGERAGEVERAVDYVKNNAERLGLR